MSYFKFPNNTFLQNFLNIFTEFHTIMLEIELHIGRPTVPMMLLRTNLFRPLNYFSISTFQIGRYWSKEERKRHLESAKERRKKQLSLIQNKNSTASEVEKLRKSPSASANISGYRGKSSPSRGSPVVPPGPPNVALTPPPPLNSASSNNGGSNPLLTSEPVLLSVTTV